MGAFRILVADDHPIFRLGVCSLLGSHEGWEICAEVADGRDAVEKCRQLAPDLVILDICMPKLNGLDAARMILKDNPAQKILILTDVDSERVARGCLEAGVRGWVFKSDATHDVTTAVEALQRHQSVFSSRISNLMMERYLRQPCVSPPAAEVRRLSPREREVVQLVSEGRASKEIATMLGVTVKTTETHRSNILRKLNLHSIAELVLYAVRNEIVHVQLPAEARFPQHGNAGADFDPEDLTENFVAAMQPENGGSLSSPAGRPLANTA
jgi:DNA-binding NarL/FixJ family response regulator